MNRIIDAIKNLDIPNLKRIEISIPHGKRNEFHKLLKSNDLFSRYDVGGSFDYSKYVLKNSNIIMEVGVYTPCRFVGKCLKDTAIIYYGWNMLTDDQKAKFEDDVLPSIAYYHGDYTSRIILIEI